MKRILDKATLIVHMTESHVPDKLSAGNRPPDTAKCLPDDFTSYEVHLHNSLRIIWLCGGRKR